MKKKTVPAVTFTPAECQAMQRAALAVWNECAYDCLQATADEEGKDVNGVLIDRDQVIEIALDAGRMEDLLRRRSKKDPIITTDLLDRISKADYDTLIAAVRPAFSYSHYGM